MDFEYSIEFYVGNIVHERRGRGMFHPSDNAFKLEHVLWLMTEEFGRPTMITVNWFFIGERDGTETSKRLEGPTSAPTR